MHMSVVWLIEDKKLYTTPFHKRHL